LWEGCSMVGLGLYLTRSTLRIQNSQLPVGCMSTCGFVGWTSKVTSFRRSVFIFGIQVLALLDMSRPCLSRLSKLRSAVGRKRSGSSTRVSKSWIHSRRLGNVSLSSSSSQVGSQVTCMSSLLMDSGYLFCF